MPTGRDIGWAVEQGQTRPIREVLRERAQHHNKQSKQLREAAFRERAWQQALLVQCLCCYPLVLAETESQHEVWCPSHGLHLSKKAQAEVERQRAEGQP